jgi:hypothetical protein
MKLKKCILHLGTEKTGSTSIQVFIDSNRDRLLQAGYFVPATLGTPNHLGITVLCGGSKNLADLRRHVLKRGESLRDYRKRVAEEFASEISEAVRAGASTLLLSNEHLHSRIRTVEEAMCVVDFLSKHVDAVEGLVYMRRQDRLAVSLHSTRLKVDSATKSEIFPLEEEATFHYFDYLGLADRWSTALGAGALNVRRFDRRHLKGGDVLMDYLAVVGLDGPFDQYVMPKQLNESLSVEGQAFLEVFNRRVPRYVDGRVNPLRGNVVQILEDKFPGTGPMVTRDKALAFYERFRNQNRMLAEKCGFGDAMFDADFSMYPEREISVDVSFEDAVSIACELWSVQRRTILALERKLREE